MAAAHAAHAASVPTPRMRATTSARKKKKEKSGAHVAHAAPDPRQTQLYSR